LLAWQCCHHSFWACDQASSTFFFSAEPTSVPGRSSAIVPCWIFCLASGYLRFFLDIYSQKLAVCLSSSAHVCPGLWRIEQNCFHIRVDYILTSFALPIVSDFHSLSIALKVDLSFPSLASTSCSLPPVTSTTLSRYVNTWTSSIGPLAGELDLWTAYLHFHNFCFLFVNS